MAVSRLSLGLQAIDVPWSVNDVLTRIDKRNKKNNKSINVELYLLTPELEFGTPQESGVLLITPLHTAICLLGRIGEKKQVTVSRFTWNGKMLPDKEPDDAFIGRNYFSTHNAALVIYRILSTDYRSHIRSQQKGEQNERKSKRSK